MAVLTAYFSRKGQNYWNGEIRDLEKGNTERIAEYIHEAVGGDIFEIERAEDYDADYNACVKEAAAEMKSDARPALKADLESLDGYDTIFLGYPNWCSTCPMCVFTFLEAHDLTGKRIIPFCTNEGSGMGASEKDLRRICKGANVEKGLAIHGAEAAESREAVQSWAKKQLGL